MFHEKKQKNILNKKAEKIAFILLLSCLGSERWSKQRWNKSLPSTHPKLAQFYTIFWIGVSFGNARQFWFMFCLRLDDALFYICICWNAWLLVSASSLPCFDPDVQYSFRRCVIAPPTVHQWKHGKTENSVIGWERVKHEQLCQSHFQLKLQLQIQL